jgi:TRAP transporter TAXI family solute receptor
MIIKEFLRANWHLVTIAATAVAAVSAAFFLLRTMPPGTVVMATGAEGGGYQQMGRRYQAALARAGVELKLVPTPGSLENLALLRDARSEVDVALVQGGSVGQDQGDQGELESLGTLFYEPLWIFHRIGLEMPTMASLRGRKLSIGPVGSGSHALLRELLKRNDVDDQAGDLLALQPQEAADKLLAGEIDAAALLASWDAPVVRRLIVDERVELANAPRADAYVALYPFLSKVTVPRGVGDLAKDIPPTDVTLFAPKASLVVRKDLHPAIQYLLLSACGLLGGKLVLGRRSFEILELQLQLVEQPLLALVARSEQVALELLDLQPQMRDQSLRARCRGAHVRHLGPRLRKLGIARQQQLLQRLDVVGEGIMRAHHAGWNHNTRCL